MQSDNLQYAETFLEKTITKVNIAYSPIMLIPGDIYKCHNNVQSSAILKIGWGLQYQSDDRNSNQELPKFLCKSAGILGYRPISNSYRIEHDDKKRYCMATVKIGDHIIGLIEDKGNI